MLIFNMFNLSVFAKKQVKKNYKIQNVVFSAT